MIAVAVVAVIFAGCLWYLGRTPRSQECRRIAMIHAASARNWTEYARLSEKGLTWIMKNNLGGHVLQFIDSFPPKRPTSAKAAEEFDRKNAEIAAICRTRAAYHARMKEKWLRGARYPWETVLPDPPPPFPIEANSVRDVTL